jgi:hypothetical protein
MESLLLKADIGRQPLNVRKMQKGQQRCLIKVKDFSAHFPFYVYSVMGRLLREELRFLRHAK